MKDVKSKNLSIFNKIITILSHLCRIPQTTRLFFVYMTLAHEMHAIVNVFLQYHTDHLLSFLLLYSLTFFKNTKYFWNDILFLTDFNTALERYSSRLDRR